NQALDGRAPAEIPETTPGVTAAERLRQARGELLEACDSFLEREAIAAGLTREERIEILRGMILTRATDNRLKAFFSGGEVRWRETAFQGKGFRSLGQEAIYAAGIRLKRGDSFRGADGTWKGDVVAPLIRDLGAALAMRPERETVRMVLNAQMGKAGPPMSGKDLHVGDFSRGILPAAAPLAISSLTIAGMAMAFAREGSGRVAISFIGEGGTSLGEWHEAINLCAARRLPAVFCVQNNQTALSTPVADQSAVRVFAEKAAGYGIPGITIDGTDPDAVAAAFAWASGRARSGRGPSLLELVCMRMCGHAHHDDMLYLGKEPPVSWEYPALHESGYADRELYDFWKKRDPLATYAARLEAEGVIAAGDFERFREEARALVEEEAAKVVEAPWPGGESAGEGVLADEAPRARIEPLDPASRGRIAAQVPAVETGPAFDPKGATFLEAVAAGVGDALRADPRVFVYGEDVGGKYGNAFLLLRPLLAEFQDRIVNSPLAEGAVLGVCVGAALAGARPIGEMQFNDFVATGFNQLVNNAAKIRYRWGGSVPMVVRMPWGGLRHAGPYHSQNTEAWFYRTPGLKIVVPSTPHDARTLMASAAADPDPVLYYEHIALYRDPRIKQKLSKEPPAPIPIGKAALRREGSDLAIVSYGAYVHVAMRVAEKLAKDGIRTAVLDLRSLAPLDRGALLALARLCGRVLIVQEDTRTGSIGESL
ncbi:MAG TPA: thiamine pyrophosphate-dependent enzyme, partial [Thermoanaerobaculia bacterium]|nr:thiamine pyrophosphate-dependent enzyme [Thermoanaerobaculia bacterium]